MKIGLLEAQDDAQDRGFNSLEFTAYFPIGAKKCKWLDAYFGLFQVEGVDGFVMVREMRKIFPGLQVEQP